MCGICGIADFPGGPSFPAGRVRHMADALRHRGPDADGFYADETVALGHRRLSIIDLSESANQPLTDASGRYVVVFNGELYNYREVRAELGGYPFRTQGDTEVLLAAFATWGPDCVKRFRGMFAFAVWDRQERKLYLCRDRLGVKPLYYHHSGDRVVFASEVRSILASGLVAPELDRQALRDYLSFQSFTHPLSPVRGVRQVQAGSWTEFTLGASRSTVYWTPGAEAPDIDFGDGSAVRRRIRGLLRDAVARRLVSDVPVGAFLSGGIDSSVVVGLMAEVSSERPATFNVSFAEREFDESAYARLVSQRFHTRHETIQMGPDDFLARLGEALDAMDSPSADGPNTFVVSQAIRRAGIKVALSGVGGDELFAGYPFFRTWHRMARYRGVFDATALLRRPLAALLRRTRSTRLQRIASILRAPQLDIAHVYPEFRRILPEPLLEALTDTGVGGPTSLEAGLAALSPSFGRLPLLGQVSAAEYAGYTQHTLLKDTDQMSMAVSLEIREPFFDHELVDFMLHVPDALRYPVYPKSLLVESVSPLLPDEVVHRPKQGFLFPWRLWMRGPLRDFCEARIVRHAERPFIRGAALTAYWRRLLAGDPAVRWQEIWQFVVLEHWMERNGVQ
jgi:asparagine synthase (glutamine-hydrolysing)